jgi:uncharacterized protein (TIGR02186 family)
MIRALLPLLAFGPLLVAAAEPSPPRVVAGLNQNRIAITADFAGAELFVYGAVAADQPPPEDLGVVVRIAGPSTPLVVRRKDRVAGIWVNRDAETIDVAPSFYGVAASGALEDTISFTEDLRWRVTLGNALRLVGSVSEGAAREAFLEAVVRLKQRDGLYVVAPGGVDFRERALFSAAFPLPADIVEGAYEATVFLTQDRAVIDVVTVGIDVRKAGLERWLYDLAQDSPVLYGLLALLVALCAGLAASEAFRLLKR